MCAVGWGDCGWRARGEGVWESDDDCIEKRFERERYGRELRRRRRKCLSCRDCSRSDESRRNVSVLQDGEER